MINLTTRRMFPGTPIGIATAGKFKGSIITRVIKAIKTFISKPINYFYITKRATEK